MMESLIIHGATVIDVRPKEDYLAAHARNSINIPLAELINEPHPNLQQPIVVCCEYGKLSEKASCFLNSRGITSFNAGSWVVVDYLQSSI